MISLEKIIIDSQITNKIPRSINSTENLNNFQDSIEKIEQNSIKLEQSIEDDEESGDFESSVSETDTESSETNDSSDNEDTDFGGSDEMPSFDESDDDFGGDNSNDNDDGAASDNDSIGNNETDSSINDIDKSAGSSLNPFTQVNQKMYLMDQMNLLYSSISNAIEKYTITYSETVELQQLRELLNIVGDERDSFIMQENPENIIKYELYMKQYETIIRNLTNKIKEYE